MRKRLTRFTLCLICIGFVIIQRDFIGVSTTIIDQAIYL